MASTHDIQELDVSSILATQILTWIDDDEVESKGWEAFFFAFFFVAFFVSVPLPLSGEFIQRSIPSPSCPSYQKGYTECGRGPVWLVQDWLRRSCVCTGTLHLYLDGKYNWVFGHSFAPKNYHYHYYYHANTWPLSQAANGFIKHEIILVQIKDYLFFYFLNKQNLFVWLNILGAHYFLQHCFLQHVIYYITLRGSGIARILDLKPYSSTLPASCSHSWYSP